MPPTSPKSHRKSAGSGKARTTKPVGSRARSRIGRPPGKSSAETRAAILLAARNEFARVGYERSTNRAIAAEAGITAAAIYQYFETKSELYTAALAEAIEELMPRLRAVVNGTLTARAALSAIIQELLSIEHDATSAHFLAAVPIELQRHPELAQAMVAQPGAFFELLVGQVKRGVKSGEIAPSKVEHVVTMYIAALIGLSIYGGTVPAPHAKTALVGFVELLEGTLFR